MVQIAWDTGAPSVLVAIVTTAKELLLATFLDLRVRDGKLRRYSACNSVVDCAEGIAPAIGDPVDARVFTCAHTRAGPIDCDVFAGTVQPQSSDMSESMWSVPHRQLSGT